MKIYKYQTIKEIIEHHYFNFHYLIPEINDENNVLIIDYHWESVWDIYYFLYFDWYPHVKFGYFYENSMVLKDFFQMMKEVSNDRKWDIFHNQKKINLELNTFILDFKNNSYYTYCI
jgi:hypothetical protein